MANFVVLFALLVCYAFFSSTIVHADPVLQSDNYKFEETTVGAGGMDQSSSDNYKISIGNSDLSVGESASSSWQIHTGSNTTSDPALSFVFNNGAINFDDFSATEASVTTAVFSVSNYTSWGYVVQIYGTSPANGSHVIPALSSNDASHTGTEQFGINMVANTSPTSFGANPNNGQFGFGQIAANYDTPNSFRYVSGETIAQAPKSSGVTIYTISYLVNVNSITPGGRYTTNQTIIITGTY